METGRNGENREGWGVRQRLRERGKKTRDEEERREWGNVKESIDGDTFGKTRG